MRSFAAVLLAGMAAVGVGACGSTEESGSAADDSPAADVTQYQAAAEKAMAKAAKWEGPTEGPKPTPGKKVMWLACGFAAEGCKHPAEASKEAAKAIGWDVTVVDGKFDPRIYNRSIQQAVDQKYDAIIVSAISSEAVAESVKRARKAGIVVGSWDSANTPADDGVSFEVGVPVAEQGEAMANYMIWKAKGKANAYILDNPEFKVVAGWMGGAKKVLKTCGSCKVVKEDKMAASDAATRVPQLVVSSLREHPEINSVIGPYDAAMLATLPSLAEAGMADRAVVGGFNGIAAWLDLIRKGKAGATVAEPVQWGAWAAFDNVNRIFEGQDVVDHKLPIRLITQENIKDIPEGEPWEGDVDYRGEFKRIWGVQ
jgi:ABC-type sugar transport system substrate-binding protein